MPVDLDIKAKPQVKVPEIPNLIKRPKTDVASRVPVVSDAQYNDMSPLEREMIFKNNFGFFDKFYGPEKQLREQYQQAMRHEIQNDLSNQIQEK